MKPFVKYAFALGAGVVGLNLLAKNRDKIRAFASSLAKRLSMASPEKAVADAAKPAETKAAGRRR